MSKLEHFQAKIAKDLIEDLERIKEQLGEDVTWSQTINQLLQSYDQVKTEQEFHDIKAFKIFQQYIRKAEQVVYSEFRLRLAQKDQDDEKIDSLKKDVTDARTELEEVKSQAEYIQRSAQEKIQQAEQSIQQSQELIAFYKQQKESHDQEKKMFQDKLNDSQRYTSNLEQQIQKADEQYTKAMNRIEELEKALHEKGIELLETERNHLRTIERLTNQNAKLKISLSKK